jgi:hypothetical protein
VAGGGCFWLLLVSQYKKRREVTVIFHTDGEAVVAVGGVSTVAKKMERAAAAVTVAKFGVDGVEVG